MPSTALSPISTPPAPATERAETLRREIAALEANLRPADERQLLDRLKVLFAALPSQDKADAEELRVRVYLLALEGMPLEVVDDVLRDVLRGRIAEVSPVFAPPPPQLARLCRERRDALLTRRCRAQSALTAEKLALMAPPPREEDDDPARKEAALARAAKVSAMLAGITDRWDMGARRRPMGDDAIERAIRIMETFEETDR